MAVAEHPRGRVEHLEHVVAARDLGGAEGDQTLGAQHEVVSGLRPYRRARSSHEKPLRVGVVDLEDAAGGVTVAVQVLAALRRLGGEEGHDAAGHVHGVGGLPDVGPVGLARGGHRDDLHDGVHGVAVTVEVR